MPTRAVEPHDHAALLGPPRKKIGPLLQVLLGYILLDGNDDVRRKRIIDRLLRTAGDLLNGDYDDGPFAKIEAVDLDMDKLRYGESPVIGEHDHDVAAPVILPGSQKDPVELAFIEALGFAQLPAIATCHEPQSPSS